MLRSIETLISELDDTDLQFIRCLRPNQQKLASKFDRSLVLNQLRNLGIMQTIEARSNGYPIRYAYKTFVKTFYGLVPNLDTSDCIEAAERILTIILGVDADFQLGKTKIFLKNNDDVYLQREREKMLTFYATSIQKNLRANIKRRKYLAMKESALLIQSNWRAYSQRVKYQQILNGIRRLQAILRSHQLVASHGLLQTRICQFQASSWGLFSINQYAL